MAVLLPTLRRVCKQAKAVACQSNLRRWGIIWAAYLAENNGRLRAGSDPSAQHSAGDFRWGFWNELDPGNPRDANIREILFCPMAKRLADQSNGVGGTFLAWHFSKEYHGSYGQNDATYCPPGPYLEGKHIEDHWRRLEIRNSGNVPAYLDCALVTDLLHDNDSPPNRDAVPTLAIVRSPTSCINRHDAGVNGLFPDWSVRKVGLKELWVLKWHPKFDTSGAWTKAGGVQPEDWPAWMRGFKDY